MIVAFLGLAAAFHFYWGFGGRIGHRVSVPERVDAQSRAEGTPLFTPSPVATLGVGVVLTLICASLVLFVSGATLGVPRGLWRIGMACVGLVFLLRGFSWHPYFGLFKRVHGTAFARNDTWFYSPGCVLVGIGFLYFAGTG